MKHFVSSKALSVLFQVFFSFFFLNGTSICSYLSNYNQLVELFIMFSVFYSIISVYP